jgi:hypothetical protein
MESALAGLIISILLVFALLTFAQTALTAQDVLIGAEQAMQARLADRTDTDLAIVATQVLSPGQSIYLTVRNTGAVKLADFDQWDLIVEYYRPTGVYTYTVGWLAYATGALQPDQWTAGPIYAGGGSSQPERFDLGILNPGEEMAVQVYVASPVAESYMNRLTIGTANGIKRSTYFMR